MQQHCAPFFRSLAFSIRATSLAVVIAMSHQSADAAAGGRPIIADGTVKTADGQLLRGCHAHLLRNATTSAFFADMANVVKMRDQAHMNVIRISVITPGWGGMSTIDARVAEADAIVANCEAAGIYAILNCHGPFETDSTKEWDLKHFWSFWAPRYKDKPFVIYEISNETFAPTTPDILPENGWTGLPAVAAYIASTARNVIRPVAPDNLILHLEPVGVSMNWGPYLVNTYAPAAGIQWNSGKDAWAFHAYGPSVVNTTGNVRATQSYGGGIPVICTEFSFPEEGWSNANVDGYHYPSEWCERNGISWLVWQDRGPVDQLQAVMNYLLPDATAKNWAWWTIRAPSVPQNVRATALDSYTASVTWMAPVDTGTSVTRYIVYRDTRQISVPNTAGALSLSDTGLVAGASYSYSVRASTLGGIVGPPSTPISLTMPLDNDPPTAILVTGIGDGKHVRVIFSERVDRASAQTLSNFTVSGVTISSAALGSDLKTLILTTSQLSKATAYTLSIINVKDLSPMANGIASASAYPFQYSEGVTKIRFYPRAGMAARMAGGIFEATNGPPATGPYTVLYTIPAAPTENAWGEVTEAQWTAQTGAANFDKGYRYFRYHSPDAGSCNVAEIEFYSGSAKATGTPYGTPGSYNNSGNDYLKAVDGNTATFFDCAQISGGYVGIEIAGMLRAEKPGLPLFAQRATMITGPRLRIPLGPFSISIFASNGMRVEKKDGIGPTSMDLTSRVPGVYIIKARTTAGVECRSVVVTPRLPDR